MFTQVLKDLVAADPNEFSVVSDADESYHQRILNVTYADWQSKDNDWGYAEMLANAATKYGELAKFATLIGKYNQQVCNGGHSQYWDNGYASANSDGAFNRHDDTDLHEMLIELLGKSGLRTSSKHGEAVYNIMQSFLNAAQESGSCYECDGSGGQDVYDDDGEYEYEECCTCNGTGVDEDQIGYTDMLDSDYYAIYEAWEAEMETYFRFQLQA